MPIVEAQKRESDGKMLPSDLVLQVACAIVFEFPPAESVKSVKLKIQWKGSPSVVRIFKALLKKHLGAIGSHGSRREAKKAGREVMLDILVQKPDWKPYAAIFAALPNGTAATSLNSLFEVVKGNGRSCSLKKNGF